MIDYTKILITKYPDSEWTLNGDDYDGLVWLSGEPKPTKDELDLLWETVQKEEKESKTLEKQVKQSILDRIGLSEDELVLLFK